MNVAIMQPCYLPWHGYFSLMWHADLFIHLDDVPLPQGRTYQTRVAIKTASGRSWLSLPVRREANQLIRDAVLGEGRWHWKHAATLRQNLPESFKVVEQAFDRPWTHVAELNIALAACMARALEVSPRCERSSAIHVSGHGSDRILNLCRAVGATGYLTAHGGRNYLDYEAFDAVGIEVRYLDYTLTPYPQPFGEFDPYVTALTLLASGVDPGPWLTSRLVPWREFIASTLSARSPDDPSNEHGVDSDHALPSASSAPLR